MTVESELVSGFKLEQSTKVDEINSTAKLYIHNKSGARLLFLENDDDNKVFSISFRTPPKDSTGVAHILEHSVLCGSKKFPIKEPFVELAKGSLNTFLNAMTFGDKTMYPVASMNDKDFTNLMDVYLDAVFNPNIYNDPLILMQEGWHYDIKNKEDELSYKGVVYNEMKGALSSPESLLFRKISETLFPDTTYGVESGGDPDFIPDLTQEKFLEFHKKYYHPSNSYIFLYGNLDINEKLKFLDENYLKNYDKIEVDSKIPMQKPFDKTREVVTEYSMSKNEDEKNKSFLSLNYVVDTALNDEMYLAFDMLEYILLEAPGAPLKKALIDKGIGNDVFGMYDNGSLQPVLSIIAKGSEESKKEEFKDLIYSTLKDIIEKGIDKKAIEGAINKREFELRENDFNRYPKGLVFNIKSMESWLYDGDPLLHLRYEESLKKIKTALTTNYFENLVQKYILDNPHSSLLVVKPKKGLEEEKAEKLKEKLKKFKESLSDKDLDTLIDHTKKLKERQETPDTEEALKSIPTLKLSDLEREPEKLPSLEKDFKNVKVLHSNVFTNKILYTNLIFNTNHIEEKYIQYLPLLARTLGRIDTKNFTYDDLAKEININTGGVDFSSSAYLYNNDNENLFPFLSVRGKALEDKLGKLFELQNEVMLNTKFDDERRLKEILDESKSRLEMMLNDRGHSVASTRALSYVSKSNKYIELTSGVSYYKFIRDLVNDFENRKGETLEILSKLCGEIFNKNNLLVSLTCDESEYSTFEKHFEAMYNSLSDKPIEKKNYQFKEITGKNEAFTSASKVQYVAKAANLRELNEEYNGSYLVLKSILSLDYLWNKVRVMGGAYGGFASFARNGNLFFVSYRDPNLTNTINIYDETYKYIENFAASELEMTKYIIGTISELDTPLTPSIIGDKVTVHYIKNIKHEDLVKEREEILNTNSDKIRSIAKVVKKAMEENNLCVVGNENTIESNKDLFEKVETLID